MIKKEQQIMGNGVVLTRTYSDTEHMIRHKQSGKVFSEAIDVSDLEEYEEMGEYIELNDVYTYKDVVEVQEAVANVSRQINRLCLSNNEALSVMEMYPQWEAMINKTVEVGYIMQYNGKLWKSRQTHTALHVYPPGIDTASLYEVIVQEHSGTVEDPIPYLPPMEIFEGKYYTQFDVLYKCTRNSGTALTHDLFDLRGMYVEMI